MFSERRLNQVRKYQKNAYRHFRNGVTARDEWNDIPLAIISFGLATMYYRFSRILMEIEE